MRAKRLKKIMRCMIIGTILISMMSGCASNVLEKEMKISKVNDKKQEEMKQLETTQLESEQIIEQTTTQQETKTTSQAEKENPYMAMKDIMAVDVVKEMKIGWNLGNTFDAWSDGIAKDADPSKTETCWGNPITTPELIDTVLEQGFNVIRIPVTWKGHMGDEPEYKIEESWMARVKEVVDYAYDKGAYVILNTHHEDWNYPYYENQEVASAQMKAVWTQIAETFADYDEHLIFEGQNEPRKVGTSVEWTGGDAEGWEVVNALNQVFIDTVRGCGGSHEYRILMIPGYGANCTVGIKHLQIPEVDNKIIASVHAYEPYDFALNMSGRAEWNHDTYAIDHLMQDLQTLFLDKGIPVIIGEFAAMNRNNDDERTQWATYYVSAAREKGIPCIWWDNGIFEGDGERLGLFDRRNLTCAYPSILEALMKASE